MEKLLQEKLLPVAARLGNNKALVSIRDGITLTIPLLLIGSLLMVIASFPIPGWEKYLGDIGVADYLWKGVDSSFGLLGLVASFGIAYFMARQYKVDGIPAGIVSLSSFITVTPFIRGEAGAGMPTAFMASKGLFVAMILGLINGYIYQWFINHNIQIKMPDGVPPAVSKSFSAIIPGAVTIVGWLIVYATLDKLSLPNLHEIAQVAYQTGETLPNIFTSVFMDNFVFIGGGGATIGLVLALGYLAHKKKASKQLKTLAPITVIPGLFNINEPAMFGVPIVLNILLLVPFILAPMFNLLVAWGAMASGLVPLTYTDPGWTMPPVISGLLATGSISGSLLQIVLIVLDVLLYLPFVIAIEKRFKLLEDCE